MQFSLMIKGTASQLAAILATLPEGTSVDAPTGSMTFDPATMNVTSVTQPIPPMPTAPTGGDEGDEDNAPANVNAPAIDASGLPWDERIHAKTKALTADGKWRKRRGVDDATVAAVEAELRGAATTIAAPVSPPQATVPMPAAPAFTPPAMPDQPHFVPSPSPMPMTPPVAMPTGPMPTMPPVPMPAGPVPTVPPAPMPTMPQPAAPAPAPLQAAVDQASGALDFAGFMQHLTGLMTRRDAQGLPLINADYLAGITAEISTAFGQQLSAITDIAADPNKINYAVQLLQRDGRW